MVELKDDKTAEEVFTRNSYSIKLTTLNEIISF